MKKTISLYSCQDDLVTSCSCGDINSCRLGGSRSLKQQGNEQIKSSIEYFLELFTSVVSWNNILVTLVGMRWHTLYPDIVDLHLRLNELGCIVYNGEVVMIDKDEEGKKHV